MLTTMASRQLFVGTLSTVGNAGGSICRSSALSSSMVRSLTCWPARFRPERLRTAPARLPWFRKAQTVMAASRRVPVDVLNSSASDSPNAARAVICWSVTRKLR